MAELLVPPKLDVWHAHYIEPYNPNMLNPASIDLRLGDKWKNPKTGEEFTGRYRLGVGCSVLGITLERLTVRPKFACDLKLKTTPARFGINHTLAGWIDPGYEGHLTLTLYTIDRSVLLIPGMRIAQIVVWLLDEEPKTSDGGPYHYGVTGHYMDQVNPTEAKEELLMLGVDEDAK